MLDQDVGDSDEVKNNLRLVSEQVDRASKIINQMRELTRRSERKFAPVSVNSIVKESDFTIALFFRPDVMVI